ncbi:MAG TPA: glycosyltransferase 87 family protein, partial [Acidimicrobiales bacterium]|nr:glycosyltransferase 87 family protein [Acidimicrobiales bacterium]
MSAVAQPSRAADRSSATSAVIVAAFVVSTLLGIALSAAIAWGHPILAARWGLLWRLALWAIAWAVAVAAALRLPRRVALALIVGGAVALRLAALAGPPTTSDDLYRYAWDGRVQAAGIDPYAQAPASMQLAAVRDQWLWPTDAGCAALHRPPGCTRINRPAERTIYPPVAEAWFGAVYRFGGLADRHKLWQVAGLLTDLATIGLLVVALRRLGRDPRWVALYALSPIPVLEIVNNGHVDGLAIALVVGALAVAAGAASETRRDIAVGLLLGMATLVKLYPALLLPAVAGLAASRPRRSLARAATAASALVAVAYLPHVVAVGWRVVGYLPGYLKEEHYDQGGRFLLAGIAGLPGAATTAVAIAALLGTIGWVLWRRPPFPQAVALL